MMEYRSKKTGAVISFKSEMKGGNWEAVAPAPAVKKTTARKTKGAPKK